LSGKDTAKVRRAAIARLQDGSLHALIATTIFDEGVDIPELKKVILASGGKSQVKLIQRVGRAVRLANGKTEAMIVDFQDAHNPTLKRHAAARRKVYKEQEFDVVEE
jgi:superfamily II DNA or RNA helicase